MGAKVSNDRGISVKILGRDYQVACPEGKEASLLDAAYFLDRRMAEIRNSSRVFGLERIAVMAALNLAHELLLHRNRTSDYTEIITEQLQNLNHKLEATLNTGNDANAPSHETNHNATHQQNQVSQEAYPQNSSNLETNHRSTNCQIDSVITSSDNGSVYESVAAGARLEMA